MLVIRHEQLPAPTGDATSGQRVADASCGIHAFEAWVHRLGSGQKTTELRHTGELIVWVQAGSGKLLLDGAPLVFQAPCTVVVPAGADFRFANQGQQALELVWVCTERPQAVCAPTKDEAPRNLPWPN